MVARERRFRDPHRASEDPEASCCCHAGILGNAASKNGHGTVVFQGARPEREIPIKPALEDRHLTVVVDGASSCVRLVENKRALFDRHNTGTEQSGGSSSSDVPGECGPIKPHLSAPVEEASPIP